MDYVSQLPSELLTLIIHYINYKEIYININVLSKYWCTFLNKRDPNNKKIIYTLYHMECNHSKLNVRMFQIEDCNFKYLGILDFKCVQFNDSIQISSLQNLGLLRFSRCIINTKLFELTPRSLKFIKYDECDVPDVNFIIDSRHKISEFEFRGHIMNNKEIVHKLRNINLPLTLEEICLSYIEVDFNIFSKLNKLQNLGCSFCKFFDNDKNELISMPSSLTRLKLYSGKIRANILALNLSLKNCIFLQEIISNGVHIANLITNNFVNLKNLNSCNYINILTDLTLNNIGLTNMPIIPNSVKKLDISHNQITSIKILPDSVTDFNCSHNLISQLDIIYECNIKSLDCSHNKIQEVIDTFNLEQINCSNNELIKIKINSYLKRLICNNNNKLRTLTIPSGELRFLEFSNNLDLEILISADKEMRIFDSFIDYIRSRNDLNEVLLILHEDDEQIVKYTKF